MKEMSRIPRRILRTRTGELHCVEKHIVEIAVLDGLEHIHPRLSITGAEDMRILGQYILDGR